MPVTLPLNSRSALGNAARGLPTAAISARIAGDSRPNAGLRRPAGVVRAPPARRFRVVSARCRAAHAPLCACACEDGSSPRCAPNQLAGLVGRAGSMRGKMTSEVRESAAQRYQLGSLMPDSSATRPQSLLVSLRPTEEGRNRGRRLGGWPQGRRLPGPPRPMETGSYREHENLSYREHACSLHQGRWTRRNCQGRSGPVRQRSQAGNTAKGARCRAKVPGDSRRMLSRGAPVDDYMSLPVL